MLQTKAHSLYSFLANIIHCDTSHTPDKMKGTANDNHNKRSSTLLLGMVVLFCNTFLILAKKNIFQSSYHYHYHKYISGGFFSLHGYFCFSLK